MFGLMKKVGFLILALSLAAELYAGGPPPRREMRKPRRGRKKEMAERERRAKEAQLSKEQQAMQDEFAWWPTDAKPRPVKDPEKGGYWWWPTEPGKARPWGNRGYVYVYKIIYDYRADELGPARPGEGRPSLVIKQIIKNVKIYYDLDSAQLRKDHTPILRSAVRALKRNPEADILITGNCDTRGPEGYNLRLGRRRANTVKNFMVKNGIDSDRIKIISRGKLDAVAPVTDLVGMQKERNAQFMVAEVEEITIPAPGKAARTRRGRPIVEVREDIESEVKVATREYVVKKGETLSEIAKREYGKAYRWKYLYELNRDRIRDPNRLRAGQKILIPVE